MKAFAELFAQDADFVNIVGKQMNGRDEIESHHAAIHAGHYGDSRLTANPLGVRFLRPDVAIVHMATEIVYNEAQEKRASLLTLVLTNQGNRWLVAAAHNTLTGGSPIVPASTAKRQYTPLRRVNLVAWRDGVRAHVLRSVEEVAQGRANGELTVTQPGVVVNMPFLSWPGGER